jgi:hypothetical protein
MSIGLIFWILMLLWLVLGLWMNWPGRPALPYGMVGSTLLLFVLFLILGWKVFGPAIHG